MATTRERIEQLLDAMSDEQLAEAQARLERLVDPVVLAFLNAPEDDEPTTAEDLEALAEAQADAERGETVPLETVMAELAAPTTR